MRKNLLAAAGCIATCFGSTIAQQPAASIDPGPLLCYTTIDGRSGERENVLYWASVAGTGPGVEFWRSRNGAHVVQRLDRNALLVATSGTPARLVVVDLATGTPRPLSGSPYEFVAVHGDDVLFLGRARDADDFLYTASWRPAGEHRRLAEARLSRVPIVQGNLAIGITADGREVWAISLARAAGRKVCAIDASPSPSLALSPSGQHLAVGLVDARGTGVLSVIEVGSGRELHTWRDLPIQVSALSSSTPRLEVGWHDAEHVVCSETRGDAQGLRGNFVFVRRSLRSGEVMDEAAYGQIDLSHRVPPVPGALPPAPPQFVIESDRTSSRLLRASGRDVLAEVPRAREQYQDLWVGPDGRCATARLGDKRDQLMLFTADAKAPRLLGTAWAHDLRLLPAAH